jgi:Ricin-type beta-trefoil lectin domain
MKPQQMSLRAALGVALLLAACDQQPTEPPPAVSEAIRLTPPASQTVPHPFVGQVVNLVLLGIDEVTQCLDVAGGLANAGDDVQVYPCHNGLNQQWRIEAAPLSVGSLEHHDLRILRTRRDLVMLRSMKNPNMCLDVRAATTNGGEQMQVFDCHGQRNQAFQLPQPVAGSQSPTSGYIKTELSGFTMALEAGTLPDRLVRQKAWNTLARQRWGFQIAGTGFRL